MNSNYLKVLVTAIALGSASLLLGVAHAEGTTEKGQTGVNPHGGIEWFLFDQDEQDAQPGGGVEW